MVFLVFPVNCTWRAAQGACSPSAGEAKGGTSAKMGGNDGLALIPLIQSFQK